MLSLSLCPVFLPSCQRYCPERAPQEISCKQISISQSVFQVIQYKTDGKAWDFPKGESNYLQKRTCTDTKRHFSISSDSVKWYYFLFEIRILFLLKGEFTATIWRNKLFHSHSIKVTHCFSVMTQKVIELALTWTPHIHAIYQSALSKKHCLTFYIINVKLREISCLA